MSSVSETRVGKWVEPGRPGPLELLLSALAYPGLVWRHRDLVLASLGRELRARFRGSALGIGWVLLQPLLLFGVYALLFTRILGVRMVPSAEAPGTAMGVYMFTGTLIWSSFAEAIGRSTSCILDNRNLVQKLCFPSELLSFNIACSSLVTTLAGLFAFCLLAAFTPVWPAPGWLLLWVPVLLVLQVIFTTGLGLLLAASHVYLRDTGPVVTALLTMWMFATPIFWVPLPEVLPGIESFLPLVEANPAHHLIHAWRWVLMSETPREVFTGDFLHSVGVLAVWALGVGLVGSMAFGRVKRHLADEV